jgi:hypothetical protein
LGELLQPGHKVLYRRNDLDPPDRWFLGLGYFDGSVACVWPGTLRSVPSSPDLKYFELDVSWEQPLFKAVVDVKSPHARAYSMKFRSPMWQMVRIKNCKMDPAVRLFADGAEASLLEIAAQEAFYNLGISFLSRLADHIGCELSAGTSGNLCATVCTLVKFVLECSDEATMHYVAKRFQVNDHAAIFMNACLDLDECLEVLDIHDARKIHEQQKEAKTSLADLKLFEKDFAERRRAIALAVPKAKATAKGKAAPKAAPRVPLPNLISHDQAKLYIPLGSSIWRGRIKRYWSAHAPPRARISEPWASSERAALHQIYIRMWTQHLQRTGESWDAYPWDLAEASHAVEMADVVDADV